jgi:hypothetical protein
MGFADGGVGRHGFAFFLGGGEIEREGERKKRGRSRRSFSKVVGSSCSHHHPCCAKGKIFFLVDVASPVSSSLLWRCRATNRENDRGDVFLWETFFLVDLVTPALEAVLSTHHHRSLLRMP